MDASTEQTIVYDIQKQNEKIIRDYIEARKTETNLAGSSGISPSIDEENFNEYLQVVLKEIKKEK